MTLFSIIAGTPTWVWFLLAFLLYRGLKASQPRTTSLYGPLIMPVIMFAISLQSHSTHFAMPGTIDFLWLTALGVGGLGGVLLASHTSISVEPGPPARIHMPGSWASLVLILMIFLTQYIFGVIDATQPELASDPGIELAQAVLAGLFSGLFLGRGIGLFISAKKLQKEILPNLKNNI
ncbi:DUF6622 family protein [Thalassospira profundimaris]|uniref:DUF6622 family protein n=1 Tax=Thalassospira profundimaris TaxID=502049 RepID=UPI000DED5E8C|nr:DUF6622 family protein [Thalassospira profundimaris]